jgi:hypothetical protein
MPYDRDKKWGQKSLQNQLAILRECCSHHAPAIILAIRDAKVYWRAELASVSGDSLTLRLLHEPARVPVRGTECCFSFNNQNDTHAIFGEVLDYSQKSPPEYSELVVKLRSGIMGSEARLAYRVSIALGSPLTVSLTTEDGCQWKPRAMDLSLSGISIEFGDQAIYPKYPVGSEVDLEIELPPDSVKLKGEVRRRSGPSYGIFFPGVVASHGYSPPPELKKIVSALEREWLQARFRDNEASREDK